MPRFLVLFCGLAAACSPSVSDSSGAAPRAFLGNARAITPSLLCEGAWGAGFSKDPHEPLGPMAVLAEADGFAVLDQEGLRIRRFAADGEPRGDVPIPERATLDAARTADGYALLAYHPAPQPGWWVQRIDEQGNLWEQRDVPAAADAPSGIFVEGGEVYVENAHGELVAAGEDAGPTGLPGRPSGAGRYVSARKNAEGVELIWSTAAGEARPVQLIVDRNVGNVVSLDAHGDLAFVGLFLFDEDDALEMVDPEIRVVAVDRLGHVRDEVTAEISDPFDANRWLSADPSGRVYQLRPMAAGLQVRGFQMEVQ